jgi:hypothetical protein
MLEQGVHILVYCMHIFCMHIRKAIFCFVLFIINIKNQIIYVRKYQIFTSATKLSLIPAYS